MGLFAAKLHGGGHDRAAGGQIPAGSIRTSVIVTRRQYEGTHPYARQIRPAFERRPRDSTPFEHTFICDWAHRCDRIVLLLATALVAAALVGCTPARMPGAMLPDGALQMPQRFVVVTLPNPVDFLPHAASTPKGYEVGPYQVGSAAQRASRTIAASYRLREVSSWPIAALGVACVVYQLPTDADTVADRGRLLAALTRDSRITSAQALHEFRVKFDNVPAPSAREDNASSDPIRGRRVNIRAR